MKLDVKIGTTSKRVAVFIQSSVATDGGGLTGLTNASSGLAWYYWREDAGNNGGTSVSPQSATRGSWTSGGFKEIDATNLPGWYELGIPDAALASGASWVIMMLKGAANMVPTPPIEIQLVSYDPYDAVRLGLTALSSVANAQGVKKNTILTAFPFPMLDASGVAVTGATVTATRMIDGAAFASCANSVTEVSNGWYKITLAAADLNGTTIALRFSASGAVDTDIIILTQA